MPGHHSPAAMERSTPIVQTETTKTISSAKVDNAVYTLPYLLFRQADCMSLLPCAAVLFLLQLQQQQQLLLQTESILNETSNSMSTSIMNVLFTLPARRRPARTYRLRCQVLRYYKGIRMPTPAPTRCHLTHEQPRVVASTSPTLVGALLVILLHRTGNT